MATEVSTAHISDDRDDAATTGSTLLRPDRLVPALLLTVTAVIYLWALHINGWGNDFYAAAIQSGAHSWKAWFFGSSDWGNSITVDKPPASLWIPGLSVCIFGLNSWAMLIPQALMGVASVGLLYLIVKKQFGVTAGAIAGAAFALTPVAAMMFRFNNPDALLVLLMIASVWAMQKAMAQRGTAQRGTETGQLQWMILTGVFVGFGFLTKQLQVMLIVPALAVTYLAFGPRTVLIRLGHLLAALGALIVSAGWWVLTVELWPKDSRPYIGGSSNNSILELTLGYNGLGRITGHESSGRGGGMPPPPSGMHFGGPGGGGPPGFGGQTGWARMFDAGQGSQIAWLIPAGGILVIAAIVLRGRAARTDGDRAQLVFWLLWGVTTAVVFSFMSGIFHSYYTIALAPAVAAGFGAGAIVCWRRRELWWVRVVMAVTSVLTGVTAFVLLNRTADYLPWLRWVILVAAVIAAIGLVLPLAERPGRLAAALAIVAALLAPTVYTLNTINHPRTGPVPSAGPGDGGGFGGFGRGRMPMPGSGPGSAAPGGMPGMGSGSPGMPGGATPPGIPGGATPPGMPGGASDSGASGGMPGAPGGMRMAMGGPGNQKPSAELVSLLQTDADEFTWAAATVASMSASPLQLAVGHPVMPIGGFGGGDPSPTFEQFKGYVAEHKIHYFVDSAFGGMGGGVHADLLAWIRGTFTSRTVDGVTVYDLTSPK